MNFLKNLQTDHSKAQAKGGSAIESEQRTSLEAQLNPPHTTSPPLCLTIERASPKQLNLVNVATKETLYKIQDTGRRTWSSKPDYEIFRVDGGDALIGSVRMKARGPAVELPLAGKKIADAEKFEACGSGNGRNLRWETQHVGRQRHVDRYDLEADTGTDDRGSVSAASRAAGWIVILDCVAPSSNPVAGAGHEKGDRVCAVKLVDALPHGRLEIWDEKACVDVGGDWGYLDELVTVAYANMEAARRRVMSLPDSTTLAFSAVGLGMNGPSVMT